ncbi:MAG TPA: M20/M25/M40 family metallo-hydrolase [Candidatus Saccharimonadales bacterium]|nr:M20/M25/M40 family metallo-hydrolase [Candidatus Saccharimonadales bacterium]
METYLQNLVAMPTVSGNHQANNKALDYVESFCVAHGLHVKRFVFNGFGALVATTVKDSKTPKVMLTGHLDVVPAPAELFTLREEAGKWFGRGVYDMKFAIAAYMAVIDQLAASKTLLQYDLGLMLTTDEELGGHNGILRLVEMGYKPGICILPDGGEDWNIETLAKGLSYGHMYAAGKTAHGSRPWDGESAIFKLLDAIAELRVLFADQKINSSSLNVGQIDGGEAINQIPSKAHATLDIRYISDEARKQLYPQIQEIFARHEITYEEEFYDLPVVTDLEHPLVKPFIESVQKVTNYTPTGTLSVGGSDARHLAKVGVPAILTHPPGGNQHGADEWISKQGALQFQDVLLDYLDKTAR